MMRRYVTKAALRDLETRLTERDRQVLRYVSDLRFVSGDQLTRLCFSGSGDAATDARAARRALVRLTRLGVLARLPRSVGGVRAGSAGFVYHLGLAGQHLAASHDWQPERARRRSQVPGTLFVDHALLVSELHVQLIECDRSARLELLALESEPSCWRELDGLALQRSRLKPDSYVRVGVGPYEDSYFIEVDRGTEGSRALERQLGLYVAYHGSGAEQAQRGVFPKVLWLTTAAERIGAVEACVQRLPADAQALFAIAPFAKALETILQTDE